MRSLTRAQLALFLSGGDVPGQVSAIRGDEQVTTVHYRGYDFQQTYDRDGADAQWWPRSFDLVPPEGWPEELGTSVLTGDFLPVEGLLDVSGVIRDLDALIDWMERDRIVKTYAEQLDVPRYLLGGV